MLGRPDLLADFLRKLACYQPTPDEEVELVINGDFIDFLAEEPPAAWTPSEDEVLRKLDNVVASFGDVFAALAHCTETISRVTVLLGNHDVELTFPRVRARLLGLLRRDAHSCNLVFSNECYRVGDVVMEHGNRYDAWNAIDHNGLREHASALSRGESIPPSFEVAPGSRLVAEVLSPLRQRYQFVELLKPEDKVVVLLLSALEPALQRNLGMIWEAARGYAKQHFRRQPSSDAAGGARRLVSADPDGSLSARAQGAFADELSAPARREVGLGSWWRMPASPTPDSMAALLASGEPIDPRRTAKLQAALRERLTGDTTFDEGSADDAYAVAAEALCTRTGAQLAVMGHTHLQRNVSFRSGAQYINTGTWADVLRVDNALLEDRPENQAAFIEWLRALVTNSLGKMRTCPATYADISVDAEGHLTRPGLLRRHALEEPVGH